MDKAKDIGAGLWQSTPGRWELVRVWHRESDDVFFFEAVDSLSGYVYGVNVAGYGRRDLGHLYLAGKLSLSPDRLRAEGHTTVVVAVIQNRDGIPVLDAIDPEVGVGPLLDDPAFYPAPVLN